MANDLSFIRRNGNRYCDLAIVGGDLAVGDYLETFVTKALLTDARVTREELAEARISNPKSTDPIPLRGWWGNSYNRIRGHQIGSKLWLNKRQKRTGKVLEDQKTWTQKALKPLVDDGVASKIDVEAEWQDDGMYMTIRIYKLDQTEETFRYLYVWEEL